MVSADVQSLGEAAGCLLSDFPGVADEVKSIIESDAPTEVSAFQLEVLRWDLERRRDEIFADVEPEELSPWTPALPQSVSQSELIDRITPRQLATGASCLFLAGASIGLASGEYDQAGRAGMIAAFLLGISSFLKKN